MTLLSVGLSHRTAPLDLLEQYALSRHEADKLAEDLVRSSAIAEAVVVSTCNRIEVVADTERFHAAVEAITELLARHVGAATDDLVPLLSVRYEQAVVAHAFTVAAGLDSMAVGETEILGQMRTALRHGQDCLTVGPVLNALFQQALRVGKRARSETALDGVARSLVDLGFELAERQIGPLAGRRVLVVGAGAMAALSTSLLTGVHGAEVMVANRTRARAERLAAAYGATVVDVAAVPELLDSVDLVVTCTGAPGSVLTRDVVAPVTADRPLFVLDLGMPRDVTADVAELPGVTRLDLEAISERSDVPAAVIDPVRDIVADAVAGFVTAARQSAAVPTVAALRQMAAQVVESELARLEQRTPDLTTTERGEVEQTVRRVVDKLLHTPTVRARELTEPLTGGSYADALRELFALDQARVDAIASPEQPGAAS